MMMMMMTMMMMTMMMMMVLIMVMLLMMMTLMRYLFENEMYTLGCFKNDTLSKKNIAIPVRTPQGCI